MEKMIYVWVVVAFLGLIFEMGSPGLFYFLSFSFGALLAALVAFLSESIIIQGIGFLIGTTIALVFLKYWLNARFYFERETSYKSNVYALEGKTGQVISTIKKNMSGQVNLDGQIWVAKSVDSQQIDQGSEVKVVRVQGCSLIVTQDKEEIDKKSE